ncbi:MAG: hydantoinase/oxoprolinase family protein [Candidatus Methylomirabilaceae bacterium]
MASVIGWDIGGVNVKGARLVFEGTEAVSGHAIRRYFEIWKEKEHLPSLLRELSTKLGPADAMAVTMTAEIADIFNDKAEGVAFVLGAVRVAASGTPLYLLSLDGKLVHYKGQAVDPLDFASTNWIAEALALADRRPDCLLVDVGSTTTDLIPILGGTLAAKGRRDVERLASGELIYTGALRTPVPAIVSQVPLRGTLCRISAEYYAIAADVHLVLGRLTPEQYTCSTPDGRGKTEEEALARLARVACEDRKGLTPAETRAIGSYVAEKQLQQITEGMFQVLSRIEGGFDLPVVPVGVGAFLGVACAKRLNLALCNPPALTDGDAPLSPSVGAAYLLGRALSRSPARPEGHATPPP